MDPSERVRSDVLIINLHFFSTITNPLHVRLLLGIFLLSMNYQKQELPIMPLKLFSMTSRNVDFFYDFR